MSAWKKRLEKIRQNPRHVRYKDLELILLRLGYEKRQESTSHTVFSKPGKYPMTIPKPHRTPFIKEAYIRQFILPLLEEWEEFEED